MASLWTGGSVLLGKLNIRNAILDISMSNFLRNSINEGSKLYGDETVL